MPTGNKLEISWRKYRFETFDRCRKLVPLFNAIKAYACAFIKALLQRDMRSQGLVVVI